jgi:selenocysteine lyase/cysteine desulfurase
MDRHPEFPQQDDLVHFNHAGVGPWPLRTAEAVGVFARENMLMGSSRYPEWVNTENEVKEWLAQLVNASAAEIALLKNTSEGLSVVAWGLDWKPGDNVVFPAEEFPSNRVVWESLAVQGVEIRKITVHGTDDPEASLLDAIDSNTRLLSCSAVQYASGIRMDLQRLGEYCHKKDVLFCVDAIQQIGALEFDVEAIQADFVVADAHKWLLSPEGIALFYCRDAVRDRLALKQYGWHMLKNNLDFDNPDWEVAEDARRFECGSPNMTGIHALHASLSLFRETGIETIERNIFNNISYLIDILNKYSEISINSDTRGDRRSGILVFTVDKADQQQIYQSLMNQGIMCALRAGNIRFSPHFYHTRDELDHAIDILAATLP